MARNVADVVNHPIPASTTMSPTEIACRNGGSGTGSTSPRALSFVSGPAITCFPPNNPGLAIGSGRPARRAACSETGIPPFGTIVSRFSSTPTPTTRMARTERFCHRKAITAT